MKKLLTALLLALPLLCHSKMVDESTARKAAANFFKSGTSSAPKLRLVRSAGDPQTKSAGESCPACFIYDNPDGGFVIMSADDCVRPVIGYSRNSRLSEEELPKNMKAWLDMWDGIIRKMSSTGMSEREAQEQWQDLLSGKQPSTTAYGDELLLETAQWNQGYPYNLFCPKDGSELSVTGCTATATCIIMRYHRWPEAGVGMTEAYTTSTKNIYVPSITLGRRYEWDKMPLQYTGYETEEQNKAVALLMAEVGAMIQSDYSASGTGSSTYNVAQALPLFMKYDKKCINLFAGYYSRDEWISMLKDNLNDAGPVLYAGYSPSGHAFVIDGYDRSDNMHINWGWGGYGNGYFTYPDFSEYTEGHSAVFNIYRDKGGECADNLVLYQHENQGNGLEVNVDAFDTGTEFNAMLTFVANYATQSFSGQVGVGKWDRYGNLKEVCGAQNLSLESYYLTSVMIPDCKIRTEIYMGDYLTPVYSSESTPDWVRMPYDLSDSSLCGRIDISESRTLAQKTSVSYDVINRICTVTTKTETSAALLDSESKDMTEAYRTDGNIVTIDANSLPSGTYRLILDRGDEHKEMVLKF